MTEGGYQEWLRRRDEMTNGKSNRLRIVGVSETDSLHPNQPPRLLQEERSKVFKVGNLLHDHHIKREHTSTSGCTYNAEYEDGCTLYIGHGDT